MTTDQYWQQLDTLAASKGTDRLLVQSFLSSSAVVGSMAVSGTCSRRLTSVARTQPATAI